MSDSAPAAPASPAPIDPTPASAGDPSPAAASSPEPAAAPAGGSPAGDPAPAESVWPDDWRDKYAGGDEKKLKKLQRYGSPAAALDALFNAQSKIAQGIREPLSKDATPEEVSRWREDNGIPLTAEGYELPEGVVLGTNDKPLVDDFMKIAHERNWAPDDVKAAVGWFMERQAGMADQMSARDAEHRRAGEDALRDEFGPKYRDEVRRAVDLLKEAPGGIGEALMSGRLADGRLIGDTPEVIRWLNQLQRTLNPLATVVPGAGTNAMQAVETELGDIKKMMGDRTSDYWKKGPVGEKLQARYRELAGALSKAA